MDSDNAKHLRDAVFNTINLINDLESGDSVPASNTRRSPNEEIMLSDRFVSGIKDKMIDPSKLDNVVENPNHLIEKHREEVKTYMESNFIKLRDVIKSQHSELLSLKQEISFLKSKISSLESAKISATSSSNMNEESVLLSQNSQTSNFDSSQGMIHHSTQSSDFSSGESSVNSSEVQKSFNNFNNEPSVPKQEVPEKMVNPRVGNYESGDVLIEKYFYYGNKK